MRIVKSVATRSCHCRKYGRRYKTCGHGTSIRETIWTATLPTGESKEFALRREAEAWLTKHTVNGEGA